MVVDAKRKFGEERALDGLSIAVEPGQIHAIIGLNGAGKTTLMRALVGMVALDSGRIDVLDGTDDWSSLGHMIDDPFAYPELTTNENIAASARLHGLARTAAAQAAEEWVELFALTHWQSRKAGALSLGNRQRLGLACALAHRPRLAILDEPTNALDPAGVLLLRDAIVGAAASGAGVLVSSHHLDEVSRIADHISVVHAGTVVGTLAPGGTELEREFFAMVHAYDEEHAS